MPLVLLLVAKFNTGKVDGNSIGRYKSINKSLGGIKS